MENNNKKDFFIQEKKVERVDMLLAIILNIPFSYTIKLIK